MQKSGERHGGEKMKKRNYGIAFLVLAVLTAVFLAANLCVGSVNIPLSQVISVLGGRGKEPVFCFLF